jgi:type IV pilus assembly protein PilC
MATYTYEAMNSVGQAVKGTVDASNNEEAIAKIRQMGNFPTKIKEKSPGGRKAGPKQAASSSTRTTTRRVGKIKIKLLTQFTRQLSTLQDAGLPILRSLRILQEQQKPGMLRVAIRLVAEDVEAGLSLSEAFARHPRAFDRLFVNMIRAGEVGGVLDIILQRLADFMEKAEHLKRKIKGAMIYPIAVITFSLGIVSALLIVVVPKFQSIFADMGEELPAATKMLLGLSQWMSEENGWMFLIGVPLALFAMAKILRTTQGGTYFLDWLKIRIPIFGKISSKAAIARFTRTLGTLMAAGVPILDALNITAETAGNEVYTKALKQVRDSIREGETIAKPLRQARIVDSMVVNMIDVGEETGELDKMLEKIAATYDEEIEVMVSGMVSMLEPVMVIVLGMIVGFIVVALFMPMVSMLNAVGG